MADAASPQPATVLRVVYREITTGDRRKFSAQSNDAETGGGARDLRFSPYNRFGDVFSRLFPKQRVVQRKRGGKQVDVTVFVGEFSWIENGIVRTLESVFEPPTDARDFEGRIPRVHKYPCFVNLPSTSGGVVMLLLIQRSDGTVWPSMVSEQTLRLPGWNEDVSKRILTCMSSKHGVIAVAGYMDFETDQSFCNGD